MNYVLGDGTRQNEKKNGRQKQGRTVMSLDMKRYTFFVTFEGKAPLKVVEEGRTMSEAKQILEGRYPGARIMLAGGF